MIGVVVPPGDEPIAREFFELFKTPWEFARSHGNYAVLLCTGSKPLEHSASLVLCFHGQPPPAATNPEPAVRAQLSGGRIRFQARELPLYGPCLTFRGEPFEGLVEQSHGGSAAVAFRTSDSTTVHLGFDLLDEVRRLLTSGQPAASAAVPTLELHIALLRHLITAAGLPLVEIPPVPLDYPFMVCLTHDVDHPVLRHHRFDHTMVGFLYRSTIGSLVGLVRGRLNLNQLGQNWRAALALPLLHCGLAPDIWRRSLTGYADTDRGSHSTFFVIPFKARPGSPLNGTASSRRAAAYDPSDIGAELHQLLAAGHEVAVHGIDAWCDSTSGRAERQQITDVTQVRELGVRMHWLWFDARSPVALEAADFSYDSTVGYNETVGFRAGTAQVYRPLNVTRLLELPMLVMDTALFYPAYLNLAPDAARQQVRAIFDQVASFGGALTINWHDRSLAPERLWGRFYLWLVQELKARGAWFPSASQAVAWFRQRRSVVFESVTRKGNTLNLRLSGVENGTSPGHRLRVHRPRSQSGQPAKFVDYPCHNGELVITV